MLTLLIKKIRKIATLFNYCYAIFLLASNSGFACGDVGYWATNTMKIYPSGNFGETAYKGGSWNSSTIEVYFRCTAPGSKIYNLNIETSGSVFDVSVSLLNQNGTLIDGVNPYLVSNFTGGNFTFSDVSGNIGGYELVTGKNYKFQVIYNYVSGTSGVNPYVLQRNYLGSIFDANGPTVIENGPLSNLGASASPQYAGYYAGYGMTVYVVPEPSTLYLYVICCIIALMRIFLLRIKPLLWAV